MIKLILKKKPKIKKSRVYGGEILLLVLRSSLFWK